MASVFDVAKYILEQKGDLKNPVLQELCRLTLRDGIFIREPLLFQEKYEFIINDTYPKGEICTELYNECTAPVVKAEDIARGDSSLLKIEEKLIINETLNKCFDAVRMHFENMRDTESDTEDHGNTASGSAAEAVSEAADDDIFSEKKNINDSDNEFSENIIAEYEEPDEEDEKAEEPDDITEEDQIPDGEEETDDLYSQATMIMRESPEADDDQEEYEETEPLNYTFDERRHRKTSGRNNSGGYSPAPAASAVQRNRKVQKDRSVLICLFTVAVCLVLILFLLNHIRKTGNSENSNVEFTKAATLAAEPEPEPEEETAEETEPETEETEVPETEETEPEETEAEETEPEPEETEPVTEAETEKPEPADGRVILDSVEQIDMNRDGIKDSIEVYCYDSGEVFYDITYSDGSFVTYAFSGQGENNIWDYIVYDRNTDSVYPAGLVSSISVFQGTGLKFIKINGPEIFSCDSKLTFNGVQKECRINYSPSTEDEVMNYYKNIDILYSYKDKDELLIGSMMNTIVKFGG